MRKQDPSCETGECFDYVITNPKRAKFFVGLLASIVATVAGVLASGGTMMYATKTEPNMFRPNPYTALDAHRDFEKERQRNDVQHNVLQERIDRQDKRIERISEKLESLPRIEENVRSIERMLETISEDKRK